MEVKTYTQTLEFLRSYIEPGLQQQKRRFPKRLVLY